MKEFIMSTIINYIVGFLWFYGLLFMTYENKNVLQSNLILLTIHVAIYLVNFFITRKWDINDKNIITTMVCGYTIYMYLTYGKYVTKIFTISAGIALALIVAYGLFVYCRKIPDGKDSKKIHRLRNRRMYVGFKNVVAFTGVALMIILFINRYVVGGLLVASSQTQKVDAVETEEYFLQHAEQFLKLTQENWEKLTEQEKLNLLQYGANYEAVSLGIGSNITVYASKLKEGTWGYYDDAKDMVQIDIEHLRNRDLQTVYQTMAHELYHSAQYEYASTYESLDESQRKLSFFKDAAQYAKEWGEYKESEEYGYDAYYTQQLESDARAYSIMAWHRIQNRIELYKSNLEEGEINTPIKETQMTRSIDDVTTIKEPLVKREIYYSDSGIVGVSDFSYDSQNRYEKIESYEINPETKERELYYRVNYSYDDLFYYMDKEYFYGEHPVTRQIYDVYGNTVQEQYVDDGKIDTNTYFYQYLSDTDRRKEVILTSNYSGEKDPVGIHIFCEYNDHYDMVYMIEQIGENVAETTWDYEYDENDRMTKSVELNKYSFTGVYEAKVTMYTYDGSGNLIKMVESYIQNPVDKPNEINYQTITSNEYDSQGRIIIMKFERINEDKESRVTTTIYEYQDEEEILEEL